MKHFTESSGKVISVVALSIFPQVTKAIPHTQEGRPLGMGGTIVANADLASSAWANPAMLNRQRLSDDLSLLLGVAVFGRDNDALITDIDDFQEANEAREAGLATGTPEGTAQAVQATLDMSNVVAGIEGKGIAIDASAIAAMGIAFDSFAIATSMRSDAIAAGTVPNLSCQVTTPG